VDSRPRPAPAIRCPTAYGDPRRGGNRRLSRVGCNAHVHPLVKAFSSRRRRIPIVARFRLPSESMTPHCGVDSEPS
jgi:hypothetical protein